MVDSDCADYLVRVGFEHWTRSHSHGMRYNVMTSNVAESLNAALSEAREYPIIALLEYIRTTLMGWFSGRHEKAAHCGRGGACNSKGGGVDLKEFRCVNWIIGLPHQQS